MKDQRFHLPDRPPVSFITHIQLKNPGALSVFPGVEIMRYVRLNAEYWMSVAC